MSTRKNRSLVPRCKLSRDKQEKLIGFFLSGCTARDAAARTRVNRNTATLFFRKLRRIIATRKRRHIGGVVEVDETYLSGGEGGRKKARKGRSLEGKIALVGVVERGTRKLHICENHPLSGFYDLDREGIRKVLEEQLALPYCEDKHLFIEQIQQRTGIAPHLMEPVDMLKQVDVIWKENLLNDRRKKDLAAMHTAVISLSPVYCKLLSDSGKDTDAYLLDIASKSMRHLEKQLLPMFSKREGKKLKQEDVKLAYLVGIHHDRQHIHAHLAIYPFTKRGDFVKIATDKKRGFDAYNAVRDFSRKYALEKFKKELYAPALMIEKGQDQIWQKNLVFAKAFHDTMQYTGRNTDAQLAGKLYQKAEDISSLPEAQFHQKVSEAYEWAEGRFKDLKQTRISQGELDATKEGLDALKNEARGLTQELTKSHTETTRLKEQMDETERQIARFDGDDFPPRTGDRQEDIDDGLFNSSFTDDDDDEQDKEFARIMGQMLDLITGKMHMTMMSLFKDMLRGAYKKAPPDDRRKLRAAVRPHPDSEPSDEQKEGRRMIKEKLMEKRDELQKALEQSEEKSFQTLDRLRIVSFRHTAGMMDLYLKQNIVSNTKPMLFSPQIKDILAESKNKGKHMEDIHTAMQKIRENDTALRNTPEILYSKLKKEPTLKDVVQIAPESEVAEKYSDIQKEMASLSL